MCPVKESVQWCQQNGYNYQILQSHKPYVVNKSAYIDFTTKVAWGAVNGFWTHTYLNINIKGQVPIEPLNMTMRFKSPVVSVVQDQRAVKFNFSDGSSLTSLVLTEQMIDTAAFFQGDWTPLKLTESLDKLDCEHVLFKDGNANYLSDNIEGCIESCVDSNINVDIAKESLDVLLTVSADIRLSDDGNRLQAFGDTCRVIASTRRV